jgi:D-aspartate ligase
MLSVLIPDGEYEIAFKVMTCLAQTRGTRIHVISVKKHPRTRYSRFCASFALRRGGGEANRFEQIKSIVQEKGIDVILPAHLEAVRFVSAWREQLSKLAALPLLPETEAVDLTADKGSLAAFLREHDLPTPKTIPAAHALDGAELAPPLLIKPRRASAGSGIQYCADQKAVRDFCGAHRDSLENFIAQEFIEGRDRSCSVLARDGEILAYTMHERALPRIRRFTPIFSIRLIDSAQQYEIAKRLISVLNWTGIANIGFRYHPERPSPLINDFNPRFWGNLVGSMAAGVNFPYLTCLAALGRPLPHVQYRLQEYMEVRDAANRIVRKIKGYGDAIPNLMRETNLPFILRDPVPFLNRFIDRSGRP